MNRTQGNEPLLGIVLLKVYAFIKNEVFLGILKTTVIQEI